MEAPPRGTVRIKLTVAYDGGDFSGWAAQPGRRTVQGTLTEAVSQVAGDAIELHGASRTDSGAHARGQVVHFDAPAGMPVERWTHALNRCLPSDLAVLRATRVPGRFHARFCAEDRTYRYRIGIGAKDPHRARYVHEHERPLNLSRMQDAAEHLVGTHDFRAYTEQLDPSVLNTVRTLRRVALLVRPGEVTLEVTGTAFLRGMMRRIAGALLEVGRGRRPVEEVAMLLGDRRDHLQWPVVLPAKGLCLMRVRYGRPLRDCRINTASEYETIS